MLETVQLACAGGEGQKPSALGHWVSVLKLVSRSLAWKACCLLALSGWVSGSTGCGKQETQDIVRSVRNPGEKPLDIQGQIRASVDAVCNDGNDEEELKQHLDSLKEAARDRPELLLPYLRDARQTIVTTEGPHFSVRHPPYQVWRTIDGILCTYHGIQYHESMAAASEYWEGFLSGGRK